jgi:site-specific recombinase XerD
VYLESAQCKTKPFEAISEADLAKLNEYFDRSTNKRLQEEVIFNILYHFGMRGREHLRSLQKDTFLIDRDEDGREYIALDKVMKSKNVKASLNRREYSDEKQARMYACDLNKEKCPVEAMKLYLSLLPSSTKDNTLFPMTTKAGFSPNTVLGKDTLGKFMAKLSIDAKLHKKYTNHCVRVTVVSVLKEKGYSNDDVASITGHKNSSSVQRYSRHLNNSSLHNISDSLENGKVRGIGLAKRSVSASCSKENMSLAL